MKELPSDTYHWLIEGLGGDLHIEKHSFSNQDDVYIIHASNNKFYLKVSPSLTAEYENLLRLRPHLTVPAVLDFRSIGGKDHLLLNEVRGDNLAELVGKWKDADIVSEFAKATKRFHELDIGKLYSGSHSPDEVVLHGDMSMPNIIADKPGSVGYIDVGQMSKGCADKDLADAIWSLQRNMGPGYGELFLSEYGDIVMTENIDKALKFRFSS